MSSGLVHASNLQDIFLGIVKEVMMSVGVLDVQEIDDSFSVNIINDLKACELTDYREAEWMWLMWWIGVLVVRDRYAVMRRLWAEEFCDRLDVYRRDHRVIDEVMVFV